MRKIRITAFPRLHISLIAMGKIAYRINGGIGFSIVEPKLNLEISSSHNFLLEDMRDVPITNRDIIKIEKAVMKAITAFSFKFNIYVKIPKADLLPHIGLGAGTIIRLACIEALFVINGLKEYTDSQVVEFSGRGATSGVGVRTYFKGGFSFDIGRKNKGEDLLPSGAFENNVNQSLLLKQGNMPNWEIGICIPKSIQGASSKQENMFFSESAILSKKDVQNVLYECTLGILPGIIEDDLSTFSHSLKKIQKLKWKASEREMHRDIIEIVEKILYDCGASSVAMSSMGPTLFFTGKNIKDIIIRAKPYLKKKFIIFGTSVNNEGRKLNLL